MRKYGGWQSVFEFRGENLNLFCDFCFGFYTTGRQIDAEKSDTLQFFSFVKKYVVNVDKNYFHLVVLLHWSTTASLGPRFLKMKYCSFATCVRLLLTDRADHAVHLISSCVYFYSSTDNGKAPRFPQRTLQIVW